MREIEVLLPKDLYRHHLMFVKGMKMMYLLHLPLLLLPLQLSLKQRLQKQRPEVLELSYLVGLLLDLLLQLPVDQEHGYNIFQKDK